VPQLFVATAHQWNDPRLSLTMAGSPAYQSEARIYASTDKGSRTQNRDLFQNDDFGKDYLKGLKDGLGARRDDCCR